MLHVRIKMRLGAYTSSRQDTDYTGAGVVRSLGPGSNIEGPACLASVCLQGDLMAVEYGQVRRLVETTFFA
jgi:hypothetical protein